ncbi:DUF5993 family protein [Endozoicomonas gorgoniicola]|uniref:DUF5993 family protein n=1 Tax=Endozoicomonas gorgoniicola TaxID=1234144 RepID=UPI003898F6C9
MVFFMVGTTFLLLLIALILILNNRLAPAIGMFILSYAVALFWFQHHATGTLPILL